MQKEDTENTGRILIAGAGIGGLSAALALARRGLRSYIIERAPEIQEIGAGVQIGPNAFRAFTRLGIAAEMAAISFAPGALVLLDSVTGTELSRQTLGLPFEAAFGHPYRVAHRADVQLALLKAAQKLPEWISIGLGDGLAVFTQHDGGVAVTLESGKTLIGSALIGADGIRSAVRAQSLDAAPPRNSGHVAYRAVLKIEDVPRDLLTDNVQIWIGPGHHLVCYKLRQGRLFNIVAMIESDRQEEGWNTQGDPAALAAGFAEAGPAVQALLGQISNWRLWTLCDREPAPGWSQGRVTLLGDAAHPTLPYLAQGACMAIEDAVALADALADTADIETALRNYESARFARTASVQLAARRTGEVNHARGAAREARNAELLRRGASADYGAIAWLYGSDGPQPDQERQSNFSVFGKVK